MTKLTTEEFIAKAKAVHGDRYDYSKVEYVNNQTKVCIICKKHGEFWQTPKSHLNSNGCHMCSGLRTWNYETCYEEAKKYKSRGEFHKMCPCGYSAAHKNNWMNDYTWYPIRKRFPNGYWTYESCFEEAKKYKTKKEFAEKASGAKHVATQNGWINDYTWFEKPFRWTRELCEEEARKYNSKQEFIIQNRSAYYAAVKHGWLDYFTWLKNVKHPNGYWTKERCENESRKYQSKKEFLCGCPAAHAAAVRMGWIDDYVWIVDKRIDITKDKIDSVYVYIFEDTRAAYVGRTLIRRQKKRDKEHIFNFDNDNVARYAKNHHVPVPTMIILESNLTLEEGLDRENYWRRWYEDQGYMMLNKLATGIGKGSLGGISHGKWNRKTCYKEAKKYKSISEFEKANGSAYDAARRNGWVKDYTWFDVLWEPKWDREACFEEAKKYKTRAEFHKGSAGAYIKAWRKGWIKDYDWMPSRQTKPAGYWDNYDHCYEEAKKYKSRRSFQRGCIGGYTKALRNGWLNDYNWFSGNKRNGFWNKETCYEEARKYDNITAFAKNAVRAYQLSRLNGWFSEYTWFKKLTKSWDYETCRAEAVKYNNRMQFRAGASGAYTKSRINGWLDDFYPKKH